MDLDIDDFTEETGHEGEEEVEGAGSLEVQAPLPPLPANASLVERLERNYLEHREKLLLKDGFIQTPMKALRDMAYEFNTVMDFTTFEIHFPKDSLSRGSGEVLNRVMIQVGNFQGDGEAPRHRLACHMAAADLLENMRSMSDTIEIPMCGLPPGYRVGVQVYKDLADFISMEEIGVLPDFVKINKLEELELEYPALYGFMCTLGYLNIHGVSDSLFLAKRLSAKNLLEALTGEKYPEDRVATGEGCIKYEDLINMGITPVKSVRKTRLARPDDGLTRERVEEDDFYDDDFAEEEDNILIMREQLAKFRLDTRPSPVDDAAVPTE